MPSSVRPLCERAASMMSATLERCGETNWKDGGSTGAQAPVGARSSTFVSHGQHAAVCTSIAGTSAHDCPASNMDDELFESTSVG